MDTKLDIKDIIPTDIIPQSCGDISIIKAKYKDNDVIIKSSIYPNMKEAKIGILVSKLGPNFVNIYGSFECMNTEMMFSYKLGYPPKTLSICDTKTYNLGGEDIKPIATYNILMEYIPFNINDIKKT